MRKKTLSPNLHEQHREKLHQAAKYHWEFKRRSAAYRLWWQYGAKAAVKPEGWDERFNPELTFEELYNDSVINKEMKRTISDIANSKIRKAINMAPAKKAAFEVIFLQKVFPKGVEIITGPGSLNVKINFDKIRSISALREYVSCLIDTHYQMFLTPGVLSDGTISKLGKSKNLRRNYERILEAGDLYEELTKKKSKIIWPYIVKKIYPPSDYPSKYGFFGRSGKRTPTKSTIEDAKRYVEEYKQFVSGAYKEIVYP